MFKEDRVLRRLGRNLIENIQDADYPDKDRILEILRPICQDLNSLKKDDITLILGIRNADFNKRHELAGFMAELYPGMTRCNRCRLPWSVVKEHETRYSTDEILIPLCESCWKELTPHERLPFYKALFDSWNCGKKISKRKKQEEWDAIESAVLRGC